MNQNKLTSIFTELFDSSKWINITPRIDPFMEYIMRQNNLYHIELEKYYPDYKERNETNPFSFAFDKKRGRPSLSILIARDFYELWQSDKIKRFGLNPFKEYDDKNKVKISDRNILVKYNQVS